MKKKIISLVLVCALLITILPSGVSALSKVNPSEKKEVSLKKVNDKSLIVKTPTAKQIRKAGSELDFYKQSLIEQVEETYSRYDYVTYIDSVRKAFDKAHQEAIDTLNNLSSLDDLFYDYEEGTISLDVNLPYTTMSTIGGWDYDYVTTDNYYLTLKKHGLKAINDAFDCFYEGDFSTYYNTIINSYRSEYLGYVSSANDYYSLAKGFANIGLVGDYNNFTYVDISFDIDNYNGSCKYDAYGYFPDFEYVEFLNSVGIVSIPSYSLGRVIYSLGEVQDTKNAFSAYINNYVYEQLKASGYKVTNEIIDMADKTLDDINNGYNPDTMYTKYIDLIEKFEDMTGVTYQKLSSTTRFKLAAGIDKLSKKYLDKKVYSNAGYNTNYNLLDNASSAINVVYEVEIPKNFLVKLEKLLKKTPTRVVELSNAKKSYANKLNTFKNNKKYNQKKVVPIVNEGISKINKATSVDSVKSIYNTYYKKALLTINKYKITTSKIGKGVITKSKTVNYGSNVVITMTPSKGYKLSKVYVDGKRVSVKSKYTFKNVTLNHSIKAVFVKK